MRSPISRPWLAVPAGALLAAAAYHALFALEQGGLSVGAATAACLLALAALSLLLLRAEGVEQHALFPVLLAVALALLLRALCLDYASYDYRDFLSKWAAFFRENGGFGAIRQNIGDYNAPYLYFMAAISYLPFPDLYAIKLFSILFDVLLAWGGFRLTRTLTGAGGKPMAAFCLLLLLPTVVLNGAYWGQCDSIYGAFVLHALSSALDGRGKTSAVLLAVAFSFKLQAIFLIPLWGVLWLAGRIKFRDLLLFPAGYALTILPALLLGKPLRDILSVYFNQAGQYTSSLVFNAPTVYALLPFGLEVNQPLLSRLGILCAFALCLALMAFGWRHRGRLSNLAAAAAAAVLAVGVPFLLPYMHDRYFFLADALLPCLALALPAARGAAVLEQCASLSAYSTYLRLRYTLPVTLLGWTWVMGLDALSMLAAFVWAVCALVRLGRRRGA